MAARGAGALAFLRALPNGGSQRYQAEPGPRREIPWRIDREDFAPLWAEDLQDYFLFGLVVGFVFVFAVVHQLFRWQ